MSRRASGDPTDPSPPRRSLPVGRYTVASVVAAVAFMTLAIVDQRDTFLAAWGFRASPSPRARMSASDAEAVGAAVRAFVAALEATYRAGSAAPLAAVATSTPLRDEIAAELADPVARDEARGLALARLEILAVEPIGADGSWQVLTEETWSAPGRASRSRLRFRYSLSPGVGRYRVDQMDTIPPEPTRAPRG